jgi:hypothetical protein
MALLAGVGNTRGASSKSVLGQQQMQVCQRVHRCSRGAQVHACACSGVEHPGGDHDHDAWCDLDMNDLAVGALLAVLAPHATSIQRVPAVEDLNFLPDMGRMTQ